MTPTAQRIEIAEACGWTGPFFETFGETYGCLSGTKRLPAYLSDLNAMHEAEKGLISQSTLGDPTSTFYRYIINLQEICGRAKRQNDATVVTVWEAFAYCICATASQRAEAFLRTLSLWDDTK